MVDPILEQSSDFASVQFLDSEEGQPGPFMEVFSKSDTLGMDQLDTLKGGRYLLVSGHVVLDIQAGKQMLFNKDNNPVDNYFYSPVRDGQLRAANDPTGECYFSAIR